MPTIQHVAPALLLLASLGLADAHAQPVTSEAGCTCEPGAKSFESYHIHVLFYPDLGSGRGRAFENNTRGSKFARSLRKAFVDHFNVPECEGHAMFDLPTLCAFPVDDTGAGGIHNAAPFVAPNFAIYLPVDRYVDVMPWMMANRGDLDFLVHPNTCGFTCSPQDHLLWSVWAGNKWDVRFQLPNSGSCSTADVPGAPSSRAPSLSGDAFPWTWAFILAGGLALVGIAGASFFVRRARARRRAVIHGETMTNYSTNQ